MLAYVFWHQRANNVVREDYREKLIAFHRILQERQSQGFVGSLVLEMAQLPWMMEGCEVYEDWYFVENSAALDPLDNAAVTGICQEPHHQVARLANNGTGGLYRLKDEALNLNHLGEIRFATWFGKPSGMKYDQLYELLHQRAYTQQGSLWQRQMTMGPALEFCFHSSQKSPLAEAIRGIQVEVQPIFVFGR
ncbi:hypothetical protein KSF_089790 [Reticulibacter mediterranei]|uniref:Uncharacterized protein n=1 Tax=Reticulibacter mediterranei TaxID=2778369 RepID=A0A8J3J173_9CHLR|nr:hypothetical protein [Reticulibacter mediterranei]GHO98931.1 hypothetical protein KSF_089790 [Reticulibacter mediterranei]